MIKGRNSLYAPLLYILLFVLRPLIFFPASLLCIAGGLLFGVAGGIFYTTIGANLSAMTAYLVGRYLGRDLLDNDDSTNLAQRYARRLRANSFDTVLVMRLLLLPYDFVNYLSGFLRIDGKAFFLATLIGTIPATISLVLIGVAGDLEELAAGKISLNPWALAASVVLLASSLAISRYLRRQDPQSEAVRQR
ncbi:MAG TPA: VTT domain-containing protein [Caldilineaceae bacterium]|nr:VTT domain-containing protein [Caldilineaceae bacterium]